MKDNIAAVSTILAGGEQICIQIAACHPRDKQGSRLPELVFGLWVVKRLVDVI